ncbi:MAG: Tol-Pal system protein TolB, partial [Paracoccaceae bacterium]
MKLRILIFAIVAFCAQSVTAEPLRIKITEGVVEPLPFAAPTFVAEDAGGKEFAQKLTQLVAQDLASTGLFREIPSQAYISSITSFSSPIQFSDWKAINAQALVVGAVSASASGEMVVKFRIYDVFSNAELGSGLKFSGTVDGWRRMGHKVADVIYTRLTGESGYFDSRIVFVSESGRKGARKKRLAIMDQDGANVQFLTDSADLVLAPRFSPAGERVLYTSYETGFPQIYMLDVGTVSKRSLQNDEGTMTFAPRFSPDGNSVVYSLEKGG